MIDHFPPDVSLRIEGDDLQAAQGLLPSAANLLYKALEVQRNGRNIVRLIRPGGDGSLVQVYLSGPLKHVYIRPALLPKGQELPEQVTVEGPVKVYINDMWSGVARGSTLDRPSIVSVPNPDGDTPAMVPALDIFHPDHVTASAYLLAFDWQTPPRLGIDDSGTDLAGAFATSNYPKPCMYSGSMKRFVSAVLGVGRQQTETAEYISGELPSTYPDLAVWNNYDYRWIRTHGIGKGSDGSVWLVEVSKDNGVLVMPVPLFDGTGEQGYLDWLASFGDTDTMAIVLEFGGVPTGEPFPTGTDLDAALADGKVVQLMDAVDILPFYRDEDFAQDKSSYFPDCGWAFSESGALLANTCRWYSNPDIVGPPPLPGGYPYSAWALNGDYSYFTLVLTADGYQFADANQRFMRSEHWRIDLDVVANPDPNGAVASGTATLTLVEEGYVWHFRDRDLFGTDTGGSLSEDGFAYQWTEPVWLFPHGDQESMDIKIPCFGRPTYDVTQDATDQGNSHPPVFVFYIGEDIEIVRYHCRGAGSNGDAPGWFTGTQIDLGNPADGPFDGGYDVGFVVPAFIREGYALIKYTQPGGTGDGIVETHLWTNDAGLLADFSVTAVHAAAFYPGLGWSAGWAGYHFGYNRTLKFAASVNTGPLAAWVVTDGVKDAVDTQHYLQAPGLEQFAVPDDTSALAVTFVGSVADA